MCHSKGRNGAGGGRSEGGPDLAVLENYDSPCAIRDVRRPCLCCPTTAVQLPDPLPWPTRVRLRA
jgi:hypothetical protein